MKTALNTFLTILTLTSSSFAQTTKDNIMDLATQIRQEVVNSTASSIDLIDAQTKLEEALNLIRSSTPADTEGCFDFVYPKYYSTYSSIVSAEKTAALCKKVGDLDVMNFLYPKYYSSYSSVVSVEKSANLSTLETKGKLDMIEYAYAKYYSSYSSVVSAEKAVANVLVLQRGSLPCLEKYFKIYYQSYSTTVSLEKAIQACK